MKKAHALLLLVILILITPILAMDTMPNEVVRMLFEEMTYAQRKSVSRVCKIWWFLINTFPKAPIMPPKNLLEYFTISEESDVITLEEKLAKHSKPGGGFDISICTQLKTFEFLENSLIYSVDCGSGRFVEYHNFKEFLNSLSKNQSLMSLILPYPSFGTALEDEWINHFVEAFQNNETLTTLSFYGVDVYDEEIKELALMLQNNTTLTNLNLAYNHITDQGALCIIDLLKHNLTITELNLHHNHISEDLRKKELREMLLNRSKHMIVHKGQQTSQVNCLCADRLPKKSKRKLEEEDFLANKKHKPNQNDS